MTSQITPQQHPNAQFAASMIQDDEIDLRELFTVIWQGKWLLTTVTLIFAVTSVVIALMLPNIYKSEALLAPAEEQGAGGLAGLASQFGGLASMAGINLDSSSAADKTQLAIEIMKSRKFIGDFIERHQILPELMAVDKWNMADNTISFDPNIYHEKNNIWVRKVDPPFKPKPSLQEAHNEFTEILNVSKDKETGIVKISIEHKSPFIAKQWVDWLVTDINRTMKDRDVSEATRSTEFLNKQIELTNVADIRTILYKLVEEQAKTIMFAEVRDEYVFKTIDPAFIPEEKVKPRRAIICILGTFLGCALSVIFLMISHFNRKRI
ncbi:Wzz/FepE/Etk N-terminal domain-containing protein [Shewanella algae]|uniref:Wzz/FepE/Etk N-terminal domain-containing protein n=1 Tax=Shewanella algae TaxID=38313 RepID=UPI0016859C0B|nr:Wzz/FepE/Etk N-terminal domain-containing protein [Shewanella algae]MBO2568846.1 LPS O-antigen length regulator [Shewanella algae]MBO2577387.1 LPS O-antigen length regulator [Shewanella algae]MBO2682952.1 LPS O-antigen length regulator [Shewanella algae]QNV04944.1 LPS O-antigen length regulator [Shewanella algae]QQO83081.1 LPS O-antigen length regulator [Shewanella algae]